MKSLLTLFVAIFLIPAPLAMAEEAETHNRTTSSKDNKSYDTGAQGSTGHSGMSKGAGPQDLDQTHRGGKKGQIEKNAPENYKKNEVGEANEQ